MKRLLQCLLALTLFSAPLFAGTISIIGTVRGPSGNLFNGRIRFTLSVATARDTSASNLIVAQRVEFLVQNGTLPTSAKITPNDVLSPANSTYVAEYFSSAGTKIAQNNFYIAGTQFDIGAATPTPLTTSNISFGTFTGLTNVESRSINNVKYVGTAGCFAGADIGAQINTVYAALPSTGGTIYVLPQAACYSYSTPIVFATVSKYVVLSGLAPSGATNTTSQGGACLNYTPTTATIAVKLDWTATGGNGFFGAGAGLRDITITNNGSCETDGGCGSSAIGIQIGGANGGTLLGEYSNVKIQGFGVGLKFGTNSGYGWGPTFLNAAFKSNTIGCQTTEAIEAINFIGGTFVNGGKVCELVGAVYIRFIGVDLDSNSTVPQISSTSASSLLDFTNVHFENNNTQTASYINSSGNVYISGGRMLDDCVSAAACGSITPAYWITANSAQIHGLTVSGGGRVPTAILVCTTACNVGYSENLAGALTALLCSATLSVKANCNVVDNTTPANSFVSTPVLTLGTSGGIGRHKLIATSGSGGATSSLPGAGGTLLSDVNAAAGLQRFTTTTTCTTAATLNATCQTAAISFPVAFADATYSVVCSLRGVSNPGGLYQTENTNASTFKISIEAHSAAAFTYTAADCFAMHN